MSSVVLVLQPDGHTPPVEVLQQQSKQPFYGVCWPQNSALSSCYHVSYSHFCTLYEYTCIYATSTSRIMEQQNVVFVLRSIMLPLRETLDSLLIFQLLLSSLVLD